MTTSLPKKLQSLKAAAELEKHGRVRQCRFCERKDNRRNMQRHVIREHVPKQDRPNRCRACGTGHLSESDLKQHIRNRHPEAELADLIADKVATLQWEVYLEEFTKEESLQHYSEAFALPTHEVLPESLLELPTCSSQTEATDDKKATDVKARPTYESHDLEVDAGHTNGLVMRIRTRVAGALANPASDESAWLISDESDDSACPASDGSANPAFDGSACPAFDGSACPAFDGSACPASDGSANPAFDGSACPASDGSANPASDGCANPAFNESACPAFEVSAIPGAVKRRDTTALEVPASQAPDIRAHHSRQYAGASKRPRAVVPQELEIHAPSADDLDVVDPIQKKIKPGSDCPTCGTQFEALIAKGVESAVNKILKRRDSALEEEVHKLRTEVRNLSERLVTGAGRPNMTNGTAHGRRGRQIANRSPDTPPPPLFDADDGPQVMIDDDVSKLVC